MINKLQFIPAYKMVSWHWPQDVAKQLIARGADLNARNCKGETPLHPAIFSQACSKILLESGADIDTRDNQNQTPLIKVSSYNCFPSYIVQQIRLVMCGKLFQLSLLIEHLARASQI
jgi:ankyrin repeat protein